ncbi:MAG: V-type ATP synthase subunit E family protein [Anaerolineaceae bacterium]|nr:V-type ATP synthase subunit E family protein [Anaerolineaceae bacterium]
MTQDDNIQRLSREIIQQAEADAEKILSDAKVKADEIRNQAQATMDGEKKRILEQAKNDAERIRSQAIATAQLKARTLILESREKLLVEEYDSSKGKIPAIQQWNDYPAIVETLALEAVQQLAVNKVILHADKVTHDLLKESVLKKISTKFDGTIELGEPLKKGTGIIAETIDGHLNYDNTFETRLRRLENELRSPVYHLLMGETL